MTPPETPIHWYRQPSFFQELPPAFENAAVEQIMRSGVLTCRPDATLASVARAMAANHVHCVVVTRVPEEGKETELVGMVTQHELVSAAARDVSGTTAGGAACRPAIVAVGTPATRAAEIMSEHRSSHVIVVDEEVHPIGVISALDIAATIAWGVG